MRRIVITQNVTLDGVIDNEQSWFDVTADTEQGRELAAVTAEHAAASDGFLVGRITFEEMRGFWPEQVDDRTGVTDHLDQVQKYVVAARRSPTRQRDPPGSSRASPGFAGPCPPPRCCSPTQDSTRASA